MGALGAVGAILFAVGLLIYLVGWIWLVVKGFQKGGALWGILNFFFNVIACLIFCITQKEGWAQFAMMVVGIILEVVGMIVFVVGNPNMLK